jgi:hypothetical protein
MSGKFWQILTRKNGTNRQKYTLRFFQIFFSFFFQPLGKKTAKKNRKTKRFFPEVFFWLTTLFLSNSKKPF